MNTATPEDSPEPLKKFFSKIKTSILRSPKKSVNSSPNLRQKSRKMSLQELPEDVLLKIFSYVAPRDLKSLMEVSRHLSAIAGNSQALMSSFRLKITLAAPQDLLLTSTNRGYRRALLAAAPPAIYLAESVQKVINILQNLKHLKEIEFLNMRVTGEGFQEILKQLPQCLEICVLKKVHIENNMFVIAQFPTFERLKELHIRCRSDYPLIYFSRAKRLKTLTLEKANVTELVALFLEQQTE